MSELEPSYKAYRPERAERPDWPLAVIIGAGGLGLASAWRLGERNRLLIVDRDEKRLARVSETLLAQGHDCRTFVCDILDPAAIARLAGEVGRLGPMKILAHVAGLSPSMADWKAIMRLNVVAPKLIANALLPHTAKGAAAAFVASMGGHVPPEPGAETLAILDDPLAPDFIERLGRAEGEINSSKAYLLSKRAVIRMCRKDVGLWAERGARIVSISPGSVSSPMGELENALNTQKKQYNSVVPLARQGTMLEFADVLEFLTSDRASYITGTDLIIDGGRSALFL